MSPLLFQFSLPIHKGHVSPLEPDFTIYDTTAYFSSFVFNLLIIYILSVSKTQFENYISNCLVSEG